MGQEPDKLLGVFGFQHLVLGSPNHRRVLLHLRNLLGYPVPPAAHEGRAGVQPPRLERVHLRPLMATFQ